MGDADMRSMIESLRALGRTGIDAIAEEVRPHFEEVLRQSASAGTDPDGQSWQPTKEGGRALKNAAASISVVVKGRGILQAIVRGYHVFHQKGTKHVPKRALLPEGGAGMPSALGRAFDAAIRKVLARKLGGG